MLRITEEEVRKYLWSHGGWDLISEYKGAHNEIVIARDGYKARTFFSALKQTGNVNIFGSRNPFWQENIEKLIHKKNKKVFFVKASGAKKSGKYRIVVDMIDEKGHPFTKKLEHILSDKYLCCKICAREKQTQQHRENYTKKWLKRIHEKYTILSTIDFITAETIVDVEEKETGYRISANIRGLKSGNAQIFNVYANGKYFLYNLNVYRMLNGLVSIPLKITDTNGSHNKVLFRCSCGREFERSVYKWMDGRDVCPSCSEKQSKNERLFANYLKKNNLNYKQEYRFNGCRDIKPLPFDFYLPQFDCLVEIDGQQHFEPVVFARMDWEMAEKRFFLQKKHDKTKEDYCKKHNIPLLRIPYFFFDDGTWQKQFDNFINSLRK